MPGFYARQGGSFHAVAAQDNLPSRPQLCHDGRVDLPVIDIAPLCVAGDLPREPDQAQRAVAAALGVACRRDGFFYIAGHGLDPALVAAVFDESRRFFALPLAQKQAIAMARGGRAYRGFFPVGGELTSGQPDLKEGLYFGQELPPDHPRVAAGVPLHGANLFPAELPALRPLVLAYMDALARIGQRVLAGLALSLGLPLRHFAEGVTAEPLLLFRVFHYPAQEPDALRPPGAGERLGVGEHSDYGVLTLLAQDEVGGLEVRSRGGWRAAPPLPGTLLCNIGDMLDRLTRGLYRSTPHRVVNRSGRSRLSLPFFFDPDFAAEVSPLPLDADLTAEIGDDPRERWDRESVHAFQGTYGDYVLRKIGRVFPALFGG